MIASDLELGFSPQNPKSRTTYRYPALNQTQKPGLTKIWTNKASRIWWNPPNLVNPITKCNWLNQGNVLNTSRHKGNWCHLNLSSCHIEVEAETWMLQTWSRLPYILHYNIIRIVNAFCNIRLYLIIRVRVRVLDFTAIAHLTLVSHAPSILEWEGFTHGLSEAYRDHTSRGLVSAFGVQS
jgi:hypothetical protein